MKKTLRVLVTGSAGYIGSALVPALQKRGHNVVGYDINDEPIGLDGFDAVVPLAAIVGAKACDVDLDKTWKVNVEAARDLAKALDGRRCVYLTTDSGYQPSDAAKETDLFAPSSAYARSKHVAACALQGAGATVFRLASLFGPSCTAMRDDLLAHFLARHVVKTGALPAITEPDSRRAFVALTDVIEAVTFALEEPTGLRGRVFNLTSPDRITKGALARFTAKAAGISETFTVSPERDADGRDFWLDDAAWAATSGPAPQRRLVDELPRLFRYYRERNWK